MAMRFNGRYFLDGPQTIDEARQVIQHRAEEDAQYANQVAQEYNEDAEKLRDSQITEEDVEREFDRMNREAKEKMNRQIDETTEWLKKIVVRISRLLNLDPAGSRLLIGWAEEGQSFVHRAFKAVLDFIKGVFEKIYEGIVATIEAAKLVVEQVKEFVDDIISKIRQFFQSPQAF